MINSVEQARQLIRAYQGEAQDFQLTVPLTKPLLLHSQPVSLAVAMAIITDEVLEKGWLPNGFSEQDQVRTYRYTL